MQARLGHVLAGLAAAALAAAGCDSSDRAPDDEGDRVDVPGDVIEPPSQLFVLGDSLSDVGNAAAVTDFLLGNPMYPVSTVGLCNLADIYLNPRPCDDVLYRRSRVGDGAVAVEHLAAGLRLPQLVPSFHIVPDRPAVGTSYAVASAKARGSGLEDLSRQLTAMLLDHGPLLPGDALYVVMIGGNDAIDALQAATPFATPIVPLIELPGATSEPPTGSPAASDAILTAAVTAIAVNVERLIDFGAQHLIVVNLPDLAWLPAVQLRARETADEAAALAAASAISSAFNERLAAALDRIDGEQRRLRSVRLDRFDLHAFLDDVRTAAIQGGRNVTDACFDSEAYRASLTAVRNFHPDCAPDDSGVPRFQRFLFWDGIHPTGALQAAVGAALSELAQRPPAGAAF